jgi:hypothetical protein
MKEIRAYKTLDGNVFETEYDAVKYAEKLYGDLLLKMSHKICNINKYSEASTWLDSNLDEILRLKILRDDISILRCCVESDNG